MSSYRSLSPPAPLSLAERLHRLRSTLDGVGAQLIEGISAAISRAVASAVQDAVSTLLASGRKDCMLDERESYADRFHSQSQHSWWDESEEPEPSMWSGHQEHSSRGWEDAPEEHWSRSSLDRRGPVTPAEPSATEPRLRSWISALVTGWQAGRWWLARKAGRYPVLTTLSIGLAAGVATWAGGPLATGMITLAGTALNLMHLAGGVQTGVSALAEALSP